jgi:hypothetical protein
MKTIFRRVDESYFSSLVATHQHGVAMGSHLVQVGH